jgi:predicted transposase/invertase (TIGR01784 family)
MTKITQLIRFDWAMKRMLRDKANFVILEGFLTELLKEKITIKTILSSQSNKEEHNDKYNDVDILIENSKGELVIVEVQNTKQHDYFHRILFGASKVITEYIVEGEPYAEVKKVISITIAYFDLGQGLDYVYHGTTIFKGLHKGDELTLSAKQKDLYKKDSVHKIYPEYWIIKAGLFDEDKVNDKLDEWIYFLKTGRVQEGFTAAGLSEAVSRLDKMNLPADERKEYNEYTERLRKLRSNFETEKEDVKDAITKAELKGEEKGKIEANRLTVRNMKKAGFSNEDISSFTGLSVEEVADLLREG